MNPPLLLRDTTSTQLSLCCRDTKLVQLADAVFRVQALPYGSWVHPSDPDEQLVIDQAVVQAIVKNFEDRVLDNVPVPWRHTEHPAENTGFVLAAIEVEDGLDLIVNVPEAKEFIDKELVGGISLAIDFEYMDKQSGDILGPTMLHCALVSNPYLKGMRKFEQLDPEELEQLGLQVEEGKIAAGDSFATPLFLQDRSKRTKSQARTSERGDNEMTLEEILALLKDDHNIDVAKLQDDVQQATQQRSTVGDELRKFGEQLHIHMDIKATPKDLVASLSEPLTKAVEAQAELAGLRKAVATKVELADGQKLTDLVVAKIDSATALSDRVLNLEAEKDVDVLLADKKILPAERDHFMELRRSNRELFNKMTKDKKPVDVELGERGSDTSTDSNGGSGKTDPLKLSEDKVESEVDRYSKQAVENTRHGLVDAVSKRKPRVPA